MNIYEKIIAVSEELRVKKDGNNEYKNFKYFKPDDIAREIIPLLKKHELILFFDMPFSKEKDKYEGKLTILELNEKNTVTSHGKVELQFDIPLTEVAGASAAQNAGATMTYCKRYMIMNAFNIAENESDPDHTMGAPAKTGKTAPAQKTPAASKPNSKFDEMMLKLDKVKKPQLDTFLEKIKESPAYTAEQKNLFITRIMELKNK